MASLEIEGEHYSYFESDNRIYWLIQYANYGRMRPWHKEDQYQIILIDESSKEVVFRTTLTDFLESVKPIKWNKILKVPYKRLGKAKKLWIHRLKHTHNTGEGRGYQHSVNIILEDHLAGIASIYEWNGERNVKYEGHSFK